MNQGKVAKLKQLAPSLDQSALGSKDPADATRLRALADILKHPSA